MPKTNPRILEYSLLPFESLLNIASCTCVSSAKCMISLNISLVEMEVERLRSGQLGVKLLTFFIVHYFTGASNHSEARNTIAHYTLGT